MYELTFIVFSFWQVFVSWSAHVHRGQQHWASVRHVQPQHLQEAVRPSRLRPVLTRQPGQAVVHRRQHHPAGVDGVAVLDRRLLVVHDHMGMLPIRQRHAQTMQLHGVCLIKWELAQYFRQNAAEHQFDAISHIFHKTPNNPYFLSAEHKRNRRDIDDDDFFSSDNWDYGFGEDFETTTAAVKNKNKSEKLVSDDAVPDSDFAAYDDYYFDVDRPTVSKQVQGK